MTAGIEFIAETGSTNADLAARLAAGETLRAGHWLVADRQTAGRGRLGREWSGGAGNFMGSCVVRPGPGDPPAHTLALVAGLAVAAAVAPHVPPPAAPMLKWPNDVLVAGAKLAGILLERVGDAVIVGVGVNLAQAPGIAGRATTALARFGPAPGRDAFAANLAAAMADEIDRWRRHGLAALIARWGAAAHPPGTLLTVTTANAAPLTGRYAGLSEDGALRLALADGTAHTVHAGDVTLERGDKKWEPVFVENHATTKPT